MNIIIYTNILTPYRRDFFDHMNLVCKTKNIGFNVLVMSETEPNRNWKYDDLKTDYTMLLHGKTVEFKNNIYIHINKNLEQTICSLKPTHVICAGSYLCPGVWKIANVAKRKKFKCYYWSESHLDEKRDYNKFKLFIRENIRSKFYKKFYGFWFAGQMSLNLIDKYCNSSSKKMFVPNLVNGFIFDYNNYNKQLIEQTRIKYNLDSNKFNFICPARLSSVKGIDKFLEVLGGYDKKDKIRIVIPGDGELKEKILSLSKENSIDVRLLGFVNQIEIAKLYAFSDCFLMTSLSDPNPLTCVEALWSGKSFFVSNHVGNYPEIVNIGINGYVFDYSNTKDIYNLLDNILVLDKTIAKDYSYTLAKKKYDLEIICNRIISDLVNY